jgi:hypothetical protein
MGSELKPFTAQDLASGLQDRIRATIASSLPEESINELINTEIRKFFQPRPRSYGDPEPSEFNVLINRLVSKEMNARIESLLSDLVQNYWIQDGIVQFNNGVSETVKNLAPKFMESYFQNMTALMLTTMANTKVNQY